MANQLQLAATPWETLALPRILRPADRRVHERLSPAALSGLMAVRLKYGPEVSFVDVSAGGAQLESPVTLRPGSTIVVQVQGPEGEVAVASRVLRCQVASLVPQPTYRGAIEFKRLLDLGEFGAPGGAASIVCGDHHARTLVEDLERLIRAVHLRQRPDSSGFRAITHVGRAALAGTEMILEIANGKRPPAAFATELAWILREMTAGVEQDEPAAALFERVSARLWRSVGVGLNLLESDARPTTSGDVIQFDVPASDDRSAAKLLVAFGPKAHPTEWQFHLLKATAHLVTLLREIDAPESADQHEPESSECAFASKVVVRYMDGRMLKGYTSDFLATRPYFHLSPAAAGPSGPRVSVPIGHLKAVFFVREFDGQASHVESRAFEERAQGRKVEVAFLDDEVLVGTTLNYRPDGGGFTVFPADPQSNNLRVFVVASAVRHVRLL